jgi:hypothetical protein
MLLASAGENEVAPSARIVRTRDFLFDTTQTHPVYDMYTA